MDTPFDPARWLPTRPRLMQSVALDVQSLAAELAIQTQSLRRSPYHPRLWLDRAKTLTALQYPELAVSDAYKAELLCQTALAQLQKSHKLRLGHQCGFWMEDETDLDEGARDSVEEQFVKIQYDSISVQSENLVHLPSKESGEWRPQPYPWMEEKHLHRGDDLIAQINDEFITKANAQPGHSYCELRRHAFGISQEEPWASSDVLGVFATGDIPKGMTILHDSTKLFGCDGSGHDAYVSPAKCVASCCDPLHPNHPDDADHQDLRWIRDVLIKRNTAQVILGCRMLLSSIQDQGVLNNPLDHSAIARLTPKYATTDSLTFSMEEHIRIPNQVLRQLGVDIFANPNFDGWVLFTIESRHCNNAWSNPMHTGIHPLFSMFNHSCEPNAEWETQDEPTEMKINALRDIKGGEQIFICYDGYMEKKAVEARRKRLRTWLDDGCQCPRCVREATERQDSPMQVHVKPAWDVECRPMLPEDAISTAVV